MADLQAEECVTIVTPLSEVDWSKLEAIKYAAIAKISTSDATDPPKSDTESSVQRGSTPAWKRISRDVDGLILTQFRVEENNEDLRFDYATLLIQTLTTEDLQLPRKSMMSTTGWELRAFPFSEFNRTVHVLVQDMNNVCENKLVYIVITISAYPPDKAGSFLQELCTQVNSVFPALGRNIQTTITTPEIRKVFLNLFSAYDKCFDESKSRIELSVNSSNRVHQNKQLKANETSEADQEKTNIENVEELKEDVRRIPAEIDHTPGRGCHKVYISDDLGDVKQCSTPRKSVDEVLNRSTSRKERNIFSEIEQFVFCCTVFFIIAMIISGALFVFISILIGF